MEYDKEEKEMRLMRSLIERKGIQHIVNTAAEVFENPLFVCDMGYKIICYSDQDEVEDEFWEYVKNYNYSMPEPITEIMRTGDFAKVYGTDEPLIGKYEFANSLFLAARIRDGSHVLGHICVYGSNRVFREEDKELLILLCKVVSYEIIYRGLSAPNQTPCETLLMDLLEGSLADKQELEIRLQYLKFQFPEKPILLVINFQSTVLQASLFYIRKYLMQKLQNICGILYREQIVLLVPEAILKKHLLEESLFGYEANTDYQIGVSNRIMDLKNLPVYYKQATDAVNIASMLKLDDKLCLYNRLKIYQVLLYAQKEIDLKSLCDPEVLEICAYDRQYGTEYRKDLALYLQCGKNINKAAEQACIHKNSMYYRIAKIEELFSVSFQDEETCFSLWMSLKLLTLLNI